MSESVSTLAPLDGDGAVDETVHNVPEASGPAEKPSCTCSRCGLYKWYPPLLLLSTVMAGAFCWMYITKPVIMSQPGETQPVGAQPAFQEGSEPGSPSEISPPTAGGAGELDPALPRLPGDSGGGLASESPNGVILGQGNFGRPLVVKRTGPQLFKPFVINEPPNAGAGTDVPSPESTPVAKLEGEDETPPAFEENVEVAAEEAEREESSARSDERPYRVPASFMAEFISVPN